MYNEYKSFEELRTVVLNDKEQAGMDVSTRNRYPIRFVLFDNFRDCSQFVDFVQSEIGAMVQSVDKWIDADYPDLMITHTELATRIKEHIRQMNGQDCVIAPFSELARFYDNETKKTFDALLKTIKAIEANAVAAENHQRVYVPIVGLEGKMETFSNDSQSTIWRLRAEEKDLTYRLVLTDKNTFGVKGIDGHYTIVNTMQEWLNIWKDADKQVTPNIICTSHCIFANAIFAQPDNAFTFVTCNDAYEFLTKGLQLQFGSMELQKSDGENWNSLAGCIDVSNGFSFSQFVTSYFSAVSIDSHETFIKLWFENPGQFERWLLARYYQMHNDKQDYVCRILSKTTMLTGHDFVEQMALDMSEVMSEMDVRKYCLMEAAKRGVVMREGVQSTLAKRLEGIAQEYTPSVALKYVTGISAREKELVVAWLAKGLVSIDQIQHIFPDLYHYLAEPLGVTVNVPSWVGKYMKEYKKAKLSNTYTKEIEQQIKALNESEVTFDSWYQEFCSTRTLLAGRGDIEVYYWIDGLGVEWIPLIKEIIREKNQSGIFLNEIKIARALLPTKTSENSEDLKKLLNGQSLPKAGDLDTLAHTPTNVWPSTIIKEVELVREIVDDILAKYNGKKIAIISDHGITYLSQLCDGLGLAGVESDHHGRIAIRKNGNWTVDSNYFRLEDEKTVCALGHRSLCNKVPKGQGIHGGCTPEEVLVPIFVISSYVSGTEWTADLLTIELSGANPTVKFRIKNIPSVEIPVVEYNGDRYGLHQVGNEVYESDSLVVNAQTTSISLVIGNVSRIFKISVSTGAQEEDLFGSF